MPQTLPDNTHIKAGPISARERIETLDVLRGLAVLAILFVNVAALASPGDWFHVSWDHIGALEYGIEVFVLFLVQGKFYMLFAFLFGLGFAMQLNRAQARGVGFAGRFAWRIALLFAIGLVHVVFFWEGDILTTYALCGVFLLLFLGIKRVLDRLVRGLSRKNRQKAPRWPALVVAGVLIFGIQAAFGVFARHAYQTYQAAQVGEPLTEAQQRLVERIESYQTPEQVQQRAQETADIDRLFAEGTYLDTVRYRIERLPRLLMPGAPLLIIIGIFMLGAYVGRHDFIGRASELRGGFKRLTLCSLVLGVPLSAAFVWVTISSAELHHPWWEFWRQLLNTASGLALCLAMVGAVTLAMTTAATRAKNWLQHLAPVGRMALSNYLLQSVIGTFVFYGYGGYGLAWTGHAGAVERTAYIVLLCAFQVVFSRWWLRRYQFGPVEWLWRSATYLRRQPMRRVFSPARPPSDDAGPTHASS